jgi:hypothetical protein
LPIGHPEKASAGFDGKSIDLILAIVGFGFKMANSKPAKHLDYESTRKVII